MICQMTKAGAELKPIHTKEAIEKLAACINTDSLLVLESLLRENEELKNRIQDLEGMIDECYRWKL